MQKGPALAQAPQRGGPHHVPGNLTPILDDAIPGTDVMQEKIAEGVKRQIAEGRRHGIGAIEEPGAGRCAG